MCNNSKLTTPDVLQGAFIPKMAAEDTALTVNNAHGGRTTFPVSLGTEIYVHVPGLHYNRTTSGPLALSRGLVLMGSHSPVLERSSQVHAREVSW